MKNVSSYLPDVSFVSAILNMIAEGFKHATGGCHLSTIEHLSKLCE